MAAKQRPGGTSDLTMAAVASLAHVVRARLRLAQARASLASWARMPGTDNDVDRAALDDAGATLVLLADGVPAGSLPHRVALRGVAAYAHAAASTALLERGLDAYRRGGLGPRWAGSATDRGLAGLAALEHVERRMHTHAVLEDTERVLGFLAAAGKAGPTSGTTTGLRSTGRSRSTWTPSTTCARSTATTHRSGAGSSATGSRRRPWTRQSAARKRNGDPPPAASRHGRSDGSRVQASKPLQRAVEVARSTAGSSPPDCV